MLVRLVTQCGHLAHEAKTVVPLTSERSWSWCGVSVWGLEACDSPLNPKPSKPYTLNPKVLPVAQLTVDVVDDTCWVPTEVSGPSLMSSGPRAEDPLWVQDFRRVEGLRFNLGLGFGVELGFNKWVFRV